MSIVQNKDMKCCSVQRGLSDAALCREVFQMLSGVLENREQL